MTFTAIEKDRILFLEKLVLLSVHFCSTHYSSFPFPSPARLFLSVLPMQLILQPYFCLISKFWLFSNDVVGSTDQGMASHSDPGKGWAQLMASEEFQLFSRRIK